MDFNSAISIIKKDLEEARGLLEQLTAETGSQFAELEFARARIRSAAELLEILPHLKEVPGTGGKKTVTQEQSLQQKKPAEPEVIVKPESPVVEMKEQNNDPEKAPVRNEPAQTRLPDGSKAILADKFADTNRLGEKITSAKQDEFIVSVRSAKPIDDIASAIGINDKFYFIRELFSGDSLAYQDTIKRLNNSGSLGEAMKILDESTVMGSDPLAQSAFVDVVRRKFNINV